MMSTTLTIESEIPRFLNDLFQIFIRTLQPEVGAQARKMSCLQNVGESLDWLRISRVQFPLKRAN